MEDGGPIITSGKHMIATFINQLAGNSGHRFLKQLRTVPYFPFLFLFRTVLFPIFPIFRPAPISQNLSLAEVGHGNDFAVFEVDVGPHGPVCIAVVSPHRIRDRTLDVARR